MIKVKMKMMGLNGSIEFGNDDPFEVCSYKVVSRAGGNAQLITAIKSSVALSGSGQFNADDEAECQPAALLRAVEAAGGKVEWPEAWLKQLKEFEGGLEDDVCF